MPIHPNLVDTIGHTPLVRLNRLTAGLGAEVALKVEARNPLASVKDRIGRAMIEAGERDGRLRPGSVIIEPTSGNTGIALAFVARAKGYRIILTMPETMSAERRVLLHMLGAEIVLTPGPKGMKGAIAMAAKLAAEHGDKAFLPGQFENPANPEIHRRTTAEEIWEATDGRLDVFVAGVGTGGTLTGVSEVLKSRTALHSVAVEPADSPVITQTRNGEEVKPGPHKIQGIGAGFVPANLNLAIIDEVVRVTNDEAFATAREITSLEGIPAGISTGATVWAALQIARRPEMAGKRIVVIGASGTERYLSTPLAEEARDFVSRIPVSEI
ncbi:MAG: cysteine synthase A [Akkermansiaceae bacterium]|jgi:cysteine synthase A|nr:cysteine synthase A [Akkermansiaceae bacterium]